MKLVAFSDLHASLTGLRKLQELVKKEKPDLLVNLGDFTVFEQHIEEVAQQLAKLHSHQLVLHGNHEDDATVAHVAKRHGWIFMHGKLVDVNGVLFVGWGGEGFVHDLPAFIKWVMKHKKTIAAAKKVVLLTHQPPYGTVLDHLWGDHVGNRSFTTFIKNHANVTLALSGHIHETAGKTGKVNRATLVNPGPYGRVVTL
ncbi:MAG TPA: metallophosphoesterase [Candidatus Binatia bacterium]|nr:metallophosphoesterase [Candidatus Binatia bacterium]